MTDTTTGTTKPKRRRKTPDERIEELKKAQNALTLKLNAERRKQRTKEEKESTRENIIRGAALGLAMEDDQGFSDLCNVKMKRYVSREKDKEFMEYRALKRKQEREETKAD
ncbi:MAG: hypothetical protein RIC85_03095 [Gammaproteobacteria bacterium]